jgi:hypothetical protein
VRLSVALIVLCTFAAPPHVVGQTSASDEAPNAPQSSHAVPSFDRPVSWKLMLPNILSDQKHIWSFPVTLAHGHNWLPTVAILGTTAGLFALDPIEGNYFRRSSSYHEFNTIFSGNHTGIGLIAAPASFYVVGLIKKDEKAQHTALLAGEAVADAEILTTVLKDATKRVRPSAFALTVISMTPGLRARVRPCDQTAAFPRDTP